MRHSLRRIVRDMIVIAVQPDDVASFKPLRSVPWGSSMRYNYGWSSPPGNEARFFSRHIDGAFFPA
jgi:hypothetical protein